MRTLICSITVSIALFLPSSIAYSKLSTSKINSKSETSLRIIFYPGSLKQNIERLAKQFGWNTVIWKLESDYRWTGKTQFINKDFSFILKQVLNGYPLQAILYQGNHILVIVPRNLK